jgi:hypothetical protein
LLDAKNKAIEIKMITLDCAYYSGMRFLNNKYNAAIYRLQTSDYSNNLYIPNPIKQPYPDTKLGDRPSIITDFWVAVCKYIWYDCFICIANQPIIFIILCLCYYQLSSLFYLIITIGTLYAMDNIYSV